MRISSVLGDFSAMPVSHTLVLRMTTSFWCKLCFNVMSFAVTSPAKLGGRIMEVKNKAATMHVSIAARNRVLYIKWVDNRFLMNNNKSSPSRENQLCINDSIRRISFCLFIENERILSRYIKRHLAVIWDSAHSVFIF